MTAKPSDVVIIGAGLAGTLLALSLHVHLPLASDKIKIYESRSPDAPELASGVVLTPNGLKVLDRLGVYERIKDVCWQAEYRTYKNDRDETTRRVLVASEALYGYTNHRLYRRVLLRTVKKMLAEKGVEILYNRRFDGVVSDDVDNGVTFSIDGAHHHTSLLVGADGIYSSVRKYLEPAVVPEYTGTVGCLAHIKWTDVSWPTPDFDRQCTIQGQPGAFFMMPETRAGDEVMVGMQVKQPARSRGEWEALSRDKDAMAQFFRRDYDAWHPTARKVIDAVTDPARGLDSLYVWPFLRTPRLQHWSSPDTGNVMVVGDAAHAMPPSSGQGVNQALEDVCSLTLVLGATAVSRPRALAFWRGLRQQRVDAVFDWATNATAVQRMGEAERRELIRQGVVPDPDAEDGAGKTFFDDMRWLYECKDEEEIQAWLRGGDDKVQ